MVTAHVIEARDPGTVVCDLLAIQEEVLTKSQAIALFGAARVRREVRARRWRAPVRGVIVLHNGPPTPTQRHWIALLACAPDSALAGPTALRHDGFSGFETPETHLSLPNGARRPSLGGIVPHWSIYLDERDVHPLRTPRRTRPARSLLDFASSSASQRYARAIILAGVQQRMVRTPDLRDALTRRGACRHRGLIVESYLDAAGGIQSLPERDFDQIRLRGRLPRPTRQVPVRRADGRYYLDVAWLEYDTTCEVHGIPNLQVRQWDKDNFRANEIAIGGPRQLVFSSYAVRHLHDQVGDQLVRMLRRGGWHG